MNIQSRAVRSAPPSRKTSVRVTILAGLERAYWIHPHLLNACLNMTRWQQKTGNGLTIGVVFGQTPVDAARNEAVRQFLEGGEEWLLQLDNDVVPGLVLNLFEDIGDRKIVSFPYAIPTSETYSLSFALGMENQQGEFTFHAGMPDGWSQWDGAGAGCLLVHRDVFLSLRDPWFECRHVGAKHAYEDLGFCVKARAAGFPVWSNSRFPCQHYKTVELLQVMKNVLTSLDQYHKALTEVLGSSVPSPREIFLGDKGKGERGR